MAYKNVKPVPPPCEGFQFDENPYQPQGPDENYINVHFDGQYNQLLTEDQPMHDPGEVGDAGRLGTGQYQDPFKSYGVEVSGVPSASQITVDNSRSPFPDERNDDGDIRNR